MTTKGGSQDFSFPALTVPGSYIPSSAPGRTIPINNYSSCAQNNTGAPSHLYPIQAILEQSLGWDGTAGPARRPIYLESQRLSFSRSFSGPSL